jgi:hypothetical protein
MAVTSMPPQSGLSAFANTFHSTVMLGVEITSAESRYAGALLVVLREQIGIY